MRVIVSEPWADRMVKLSVLKDDLGPARQHMDVITNVVKSTEEWHLFLCSLFDIFHVFGPSNNYEPGEVRPSYFEYWVLAHSWVSRQSNPEQTADVYLLVAFLDPFMFIFYTWSKYPWRPYRGDLVELLLLYEMWLSKSWEPYSRVPVSYKSGIT